MLISGSHISNRSMSPPEELSDTRSHFRNFVLSTFSLKKIKIQHTLVFISPVHARLIASCSALQATFDCFALGPVLGTSTGSFLSLFLALLFLRTVWKNHEKGNSPFSCTGTKQPSLDLPDWNLTFHSHRIRPFPSFPTTMDTLPWIRYHGYARHPSYMYNITFSLCAIVTA